MAANALEAKAHELLGQLGPNKLAAVVQLLEVMIHDDDHERLAEADRRRLQLGEAWFDQRGGRGIPMEEVLAEFDLKADDFPLSK